METNPLLRPVAIVGMACRLPGAAQLEAFWDLLCRGGYAVEELPPDRLDRSLYFDSQRQRRAKTYSTVGGLIPEDCVTPPGCELPPAMQATADPCHRILYEVAAEACTRAGYPPATLAGRRVAVYVGHSGGSMLGSDLPFAALADEAADYLRECPGFRQLPPADQAALRDELVRGLRARRARRSLGELPEIEAHAAASLIARAMGLTGTHLAIDAACASSLVALACGILALGQGEAELALVAGASYNKCDSLILFSQAQSCSSAGSRPFDAAADGLVSSEGYVALVIKTLERAEADGDPIQAVIRGVGISSDGRGRSLWAPRKEGQLEAMRRAYADDVDPRELQYVETHATSTQLGDATEVEAIAAFLQACAPQAKVGLGSVKSNIGHTLETAGLAGLVKTVLALQHGQIPPSINISELNPSIPWSELPLYVVNRRTPWPAAAPGMPRRAGINAFGIGGLNVHVVVDEYLRPSGSPTAGRTRPPTFVREAAPEPLAVVGRGVILPGAHAIGELWELVCAARDARGPAPIGRWRGGLRVASSTAGDDVPHNVGGFIRDFQYDWRRHKIPPKQLAHANPLQFMLLDAVEQAIREAGYEQRPWDRARCAVVVGTVFGGEFSNHLQLGLRLPEMRRDLERLLAARGLVAGDIERIVENFAEQLLSNRPALLDETGSFTSSTLASRISKTFDLMGGALAVDAGEVSSFAALDVAASLLRAGTVSSVVCAAAQRAMDRVAFTSLALRGRLARLDPEGQVVPGTGYCPGEGVAVVLLKTLAAARRDHDRVLGVIEGLASSRGGPRDQAAVREAARRAAEQAGGPAAADFIEAGCGVPEWDAAQLDGLRQAQGDRSEHASLPPVGSLIPLIGHTQAAHGLASLVLASLILEHQQLPEHLFQFGDGKARAERGRTPERGRAPAGLASGPRAAPARAALNIQDPDGLTYHVRLSAASSRSDSASDPSSPPARPVAVSPGGWRTLRLGARESMGLKAELAQALLDPSRLWEQGATRRFTPSERVRCAIVARSAEELRSRLELAHRHALNPAAQAVLDEQQVYCRCLPDTPPRVAVLFPGQGSQYAGMLAGVEKLTPGSARLHAEMDAFLRRNDWERWHALATEHGHRLGHDIWLTQLAMLLADALVWQVLADHGLRVDCVAGHSYGEFAALWSAGAWTFEQAVRFTRARADGIGQPGIPQGAMLSLTATLEQVQQLLERTASPVTVTHHNGPQQIVVGGETPAIEQFQQLVEGEGWESRILAVPSPFHTPLLQDAQPGLRQMLAPETLRPPRLPFLSGVTCGYVADPRELKELLVRQLVSPVHYAELVQRLYADGVTVLVEAGPNQVLTRLHRQILSGRAVELVSTDHPKRTPLEQLAGALGLLECLGLSASGSDASSEFGELAVTSGPAPASPPAEHWDATVTRRERCRAEGTRRTSGGPPARRSPRTPVEQFDATAARRERLRTQAAARSQDRPPPLEIPALAPPVSTSLAPAAPATPRAAPAAAGESLSAACPPGPSELEAFLVNFVVEQTGYPPEIVDLDADLEADLGIDSIKRIQLLGELREFFEWDSADESSLRQVTSLRQLVNWLSGRQGKEEWLKSPAPPPLAPPPAVLPPAVLPPAVLPPAVLPPAVLPPAVLPPASSPSAVLPSGSGGLPEDKLAAFVIDFVVEQTGYPREIVDLDAHLEADLGIDSIKRVQLVAELGERFSIKLGSNGQAPRKEFTTLREMLELVRALMPTDGSGAQTGAPPAIANRGSGGPSARPVNAPTALPLSVARESGNGHAHSSSAAVRPEHRGPNGHYDSGYAAGRRHAGSIQAAVLRRIQEGWAEQEGGAPAPHLREFSEFLQQQLQGVADGAGVHVANLLAISRQHANGEFTVLNEARESICVLPGPGDANPPVANPVAAAPAPREPSVTSRYVLRMSPSAVTFPPASVAWQGAAVILGANPVAEALAARIRQQGTSAWLLPAADEPAQAVAAFEELWQRGPLPHLFLVTPRDVDAGTGWDWAAWQRRRARGVLTPFLVAQAWVKRVTEAGLMDDASLVAATSLGGEFGFGGKVVSAESGALTGLLKAICIESWVNGFRALPVKIVDTPASTPADRVVEAMLQELAAPSYDIEIGYREGRRSVVRAMPQELPEVVQRPIRPGGNWVCTGGARGITAYIARELGRRFQLRLQLLGTTPLSAIDPAWNSLSSEELRELKKRVMRDAQAQGRNSLKAWQDVEKGMEIDSTLRAMREEGLDTHYHACDVSDPAALGAVLEQIRRRQGPIQGVLHGAGVGKDARFDRKDLEKVEQCLAAKIDGAQLLMELTRQDPLEFFVAFGSISGRFGANGHTDYSLANDMLAKQIDWFRQQRPEVAAVAFHWHAWGDVGMATKPETRLALELVNMQFMPAREGLAHFLRELQAGAPEGEVLITDERYYRTFFPSETLVVEEGAETVRAQPALLQLPPVPAGPAVEYSAPLDPTRDPFLVEHRLDGRPLLPIVVGLELLAEAAVAGSGGGPVTALQRVVVHQGLRFFDDRSKLVTVRYVAKSSGGGEAELLGDFQGRDGRLVERRRRFLSAEVECAAAALTPPPPPLSPATGEWQRCQYPERDAPFYLGPPLRCLRSVRYGDDRLWGRIRAPALIELCGAHRMSQGWSLPSAAWDACLYATGLLAWHRVAPGIALPAGFGRCRLFRRTVPGEACLVEARLQRAAAGEAWFAFTLYGRDGDPILDVEDYHVRWLVRSTE